MTLLILAIGFGIAVTFCSLYMALLFGNRKKQNVPNGVVVLYQVGRGPFCPSFSPFPLKLETFLRMAKVPYINNHQARFSSKRKTPWMEYNGQAVADSQFCIEHLKQMRGIDLNKNLTSEEVGIARAFQKMTEENLYWTMCAEMFEDTTAVATVMPYTGIKLWFTLKVLKYVLRKEMWGHGIGRHTREEIWSIAVGDISAISNFLGKKPFLMGDEPSEVDCALFGMLAMMLWNMPTSRHEKMIQENAPNLVEYCFRMKDRFWPDWDQCVRNSSAFQNDEGKLYFEENIEAVVHNSDSISN